MLPIKERNSYKEFFANTITPKRDETHQMSSPMMAEELFKKEARSLKSVLTDLDVSVFVVAEEGLDEGYHANVVVRP